MSPILAQPKRLALLVYLTLANSQGFRRRDTVVGLFWPELDQDHARGSLRQALRFLRRTLGAGVIISRGEEEIGVASSALWCDAKAFERACRSGDVRRAMELYRDDFLAGFYVSDAAPEFDRWLEEERGRLRRLARESAWALAAERERHGDLTAAADWGRRGVTLAGNDEGDLRRLITLLAGMGDRAGAVQAYEDFARRLTNELETEPSGETQSLIQAVRARRTPGPGPDPRRPDEDALDSEERTPQRDRVPARSNVHPSLSRRTRWTVGRGLALGLPLLLLLGLSLWGLRQRWLSPAAPVRIQSLAVLPVADLSNDSTQLGDGLTEVLITDLGRISGLRVISRTAVMRYKGTTMSVPEIGRALGVDAVLEGGVQRARDNLRLDLRLISATSGRRLWAQRFDEQFGNRSSIGDAVSESLVSALKLSVTASDRRKIHTPPTTNAEAYDDFLRGKIHVGRSNERDDSIATEVLERAVARDPGFAAAYAYLAYAYGLRFFLFTPRDTATLEKAMVSAEKALRLDPDLAEAHFARGFLLWNPATHFAHEQAIRELRRAIALSPNLAEAHDWLGDVYWHVGLFEKAIEQFREVVTIDPGNRSAQFGLGVMLVYQGHYEEGLRTIRQVPREWNLAMLTYHTAWTLLYLGRSHEASSVIEDYLNTTPRDPGGLVTGIRAILRAKNGDTRRTEEDILRAIALGSGYGHFHHTAYDIASAYALIHRPSLAVHWLRQAVDNGLPCYPLFETDPNLDTLRRDPGFLALMADLKSQWERWQGTL